MVRYAVGYQSRAFVTFGEPIPLAGWTADARRDVMDLAHLVRDTIGALYKVLPTAVVAAAMRPSIEQRDLERAPTRSSSVLRAGRRQPRACTSGREAVEEGAPLLADRNIIHVERGGRFRVRERTVLRYYARTLQHLLTGPRRTPAYPLMIDARLEGVLPRPRRQPPPQVPGLALRHARARQLRAPLHRRRDGRGGDRRRPATSRPPA